MRAQDDLVVAVGVELDVGSGEEASVGGDVRGVEPTPVNGLTRNAAIDYAPHGIRVNSVNMAATDTPMVARAGVLVAEAAKANPPIEPNMGRQRPSACWPTPTRTTAPPPLPNRCR